MIGIVGVVADEDVVGLEIAVDDAAIVGGDQRARDLQDDPHRGLGLEVPPRRDRRAVSVSPSRRSITKYGRPSTSPLKSVMSMMLGWRMLLTVRASSMKRPSASVSTASLGSRTLIATRRPRNACSAA